MKKNALFLGLVLVLAGTMLILAKKPDPSAPCGKISLVVGKVEIQKNGKGEWVKAKLKDPLFLNDVVRTHEGARVRILLIGEKAVELKENKELKMGDLFLKGKKAEKVDIPPLTPVVGVRGDEQEMGETSATNADEWDSE